MQNVYFWITDKPFRTTDGRYVDGFRENYRRYSNRQHVLPDSTLSNMEVWVSTTESGTQQGVTTSSGFAVILQNIDDLNLPEDSIDTGQNSHQGLFRRLTPETDYVANPELGYIRLRTPLPARTALAVAFRTSSGSEFGDMTVDTAGVRLVLLKPETAQPTDSTWNLMFRHVYSLQTTEIQDPENFKLEIIRGDAVGGLEEIGPPTSSETYLTFFQFY